MMLGLTGIKPFGGAALGAVKVERPREE